MKRRNAVNVLGREKGKVMCDIIVDALLAISVVAVVIWFIAIAYIVMSLPL